MKSEMGSNGAEVVKQMKSSMEFNKIFVLNQNNPTAV